MSSWCFTSAPVVRRSSSCRRGHAVEDRVDVPVGLVAEGEGVDVVTFILEDHSWRMNSMPLGSSISSLIMSNSLLAIPRTGQKGRRGALSSTESLKRILQMRVRRGARQSPELRECPRHPGRGRTLGDVYSEHK